MKAAEMPDLKGIPPLNTISSALQQTQIALKAACEIPRTTLVCLVIQADELSIDEQIFHLRVSSSGSPLVTMMLAILPGLDCAKFFADAEHFRRIDRQSFHRVVM